MSQLASASAPHAARQIFSARYVGDRAPRRRPRRTRPRHLGLVRRVSQSCVRRRGVARRCRRVTAAGAARADAAKRVGDELSHVVAPAVVLAEAHARGHRATDGAIAVAPYAVPASAGTYSRRPIVDRADAPLLDRDADEYPGDRLGHGPRREALRVAAAVLIALDEDGAVLDEQEAGGGMAGQVPVERAGLSVGAIADRRLRHGAAKRARRGRLVDAVGEEDLVQAGMGIDQVRRLPPRDLIGAQEALRREPVDGGIRPGGVESGRAEGGGRSDGDGRRRDAGGECRPRPACPPRPAGGRARRSGITAPPARARPRCGSDRRDRRRPSR